MKLFTQQENVPTPNKFWELEPGDLFVYFNVPDVLCVKVDEKHHYPVDNLGEGCTLKIEMEDRDAKVFKCEATLTWTISVFDE